MDTLPLGSDRVALAHAWIGALATTAVLTFTSVAAAANINGQVLGAGAPIAGSMVTLFAASAGAPKQLGHVRTGTDGRFVLNAPSVVGNDTTFYLVANGGKSAADKSAGDNPAIALLTVLGSKPPAKVTINEFTTVASVWTHAQFLDRTAIKGPALGLRIAAGNVPSFVDLQTGGWGNAIQSPLNEGETPTMATSLRRQRARGLRHAGHCQCLRQSLPGGDSAEGRCSTDTLLWPNRWRAFPVLPGEASP